MSRLRVALLGETVDVDYALGTQLPKLPEVTISTTREHLGTKLKHEVPTGRRAYLPAGEYPIIDNADTNGYSIYTPGVHGIRGAGIDKTILRVQAGSFTRKVARPGNSGDGLLRIGPNGSNSGVQRTISDLTVIGAPTLGADGKPLFAHGLWNYFGRREVWQRVRVRGVSYGGGNSPNTGETFMVNDYRTVDSVYEDCDFDGRDEAGNMISASPIGFNGSLRPRLIRSRVHHSLYSGLTYSIAGTTASPTVDPYTEDVTVDWCANHPGVGSGSRFSGINHEWVRGQIEHVRPTLILDQAHLWDSSHISHGCDNIPDNPVPMIVRDPRWNASPKWARGLFTVKLWGNQRTLPDVYNAAGKLMRPAVQPGVNPPPLPERDSSGALLTPQTHYAVSIDNGYGAP